MRLKSFNAKTMTEAMQMVRETLGEDAIIVATREEQGGPSRGGSVSVTAAIDPGMNEAPYDMDEGFNNMPDQFSDFLDDDVNFETHQYAVEERPSSSREWLQYDDENETGGIGEQITDTLLRHGVSEDVMDNILSCATVVGLENAGVALIAALEHLFKFKPLPAAQGHPKAMMMIGTPGAGKTLAAAKMAARAAMSGLQVGVVSCDTVRAGGIDQLKSFTDLLNIDLQTAESPQDLQHALSDLSGYEQVIIDTASVNPFDRHDVRALARMIGVGGIEPYAVMAGGMDAEESAEIARIYSAIGVEAIIPTRLDMTRRLGGILSAASHGGLALSDASNTPKVADGLIEITPKSLAKILMPQAFIEMGTDSIARAGRA